LNLLKHKFDLDLFDNGDYKCVHCGVSWRAIRSALDDVNEYYKICVGKPYIPNREDYLNAHSTLKCITEEEFIIKSIIE